MNDAKAVYKRAILKAQQMYVDRIGEGDRGADKVRNEHDLILRMAEEGFRYPDLWEATAVYVQAIFGAVERWGEWPAWTSLLQQAAARLRDKPRSFLQVAHWLGHLYYLHRNFEDAVALLTDAYAVARQSVPEFAAQLQQRLCNVYLGMGDLEAAQMAADDALLLCRQYDGSDVLAAAIWNSAGLVAMRRNAHDDAIVAFNTAVSIWQQQRLLTPLSRCEINLGVVYFQLGQYGDAGIHFQHALQHLEMFSSPVDKLRAVNNLASAYYMQQAYAQGEKILLQAIAESCQLAGIYHVRGSLNHNLGNTLLALKRYGEAEVYLMNSLHLWEMANDELEKANTHDTLGELFQAQGKFAQAMHHFQEALNLAQQYPGNVMAENLLQHCEKEIGTCTAQLN
ncbi:MAG: tetratricopeptide repeat protein [Chloroflexi bacterium]|nr:tetratricopeptide repeat protein [Chloroflexota bacterium]